MRYHSHWNRPSTLQTAAWGSIVVTWGVLGALVARSENINHPVAGFHGDESDREINSAAQSSGSLTAEISASSSQPEIIDSRKLEPLASSSELAMLEPQALERSLSSHAVNHPSKPDRAPHTLGNSRTSKPSSSDLGSSTSQAHPSPSQRETMLAEDETQQETGFHQPETSLATAMLRPHTSYSSQPTSHLANAPSKVSSPTSSPHISLTTFSEELAFPAADTVASRVPLDQLPSLSEDVLLMAGNHQGSTVDAPSTCPRQRLLRKAPGRSVANLLSLATSAQANSSISAHPLIEEAPRLTFAPGRIQFSSAMHPSKRCTH